MIQVRDAPGKGVEEFGWDCWVAWHVIKGFHETQNVSPQVFFFSLYQFQPTHLPLAIDSKELSLFNQQTSIQIKKK